MYTTRSAPLKCPHCGVVHDAHSSMAGAHMPDPGSVSLCIDCTQWSVFDERLQLRKPTEEEYMLILNSKMCAMAAHELRKIKAKNK